MKSMLVITFLAGVFAAGFRNGYRDVSDFDRLIYLIQSTVIPDTWEALGGPTKIPPTVPVVSACPTVVVSPQADRDPFSGAPYGLE